MGSFVSRLLRHVKRKRGASHDQDQQIRHPRRAHRPGGSAPILKGALSSQRQAQQLRRRPGRLAGRAAGYARMRSELRRGTLPPATQERIALAVAEYRGSEYDVAVHARAARSVGLSLDEIELARRSSPRATSRSRPFFATSSSCSRTAGRVPVHLHEEAREQGWSRRADPRGARPCRDRRLLGAGDAGGRDPAGGHLARGQAARESRLTIDGGHGADKRTRRRAHPNGAAGRSAAQARASVPTSTRRWSWSASAGRARSSTRCCPGRCASRRSPCGAPDLRPPALDAAARAGAPASSPGGSTTALRCGSSTS